MFKKAGKDNLEMEEHLFEACRVIFGNDIEVSPGFLNYLREEGVASAFKKRAMEIHPDRALVSGLSVEKCQEQFIALQFACETLRRHIATKQILAKNVTSPVKAQKRPCMQASGLPEEKLLFGRFLYRMGLIEWRQLVMAVSWQKAGRPRIGELGISLGYLDRNSVIAILRNSVKLGAFGVTALNMGYLTREEVRELLMRQKRQEKKIGQFFVEKGLLSQRDLLLLLWQCKAHNRQVEKLNAR